MCPRLLVLSRAIGRSGSDGLSMVIFESEEAAHQMADRVPQTVPEFVTFESAEVREVVASA